MSIDGKSALFCLARHPTPVDAGLELRFWQSSHFASRARRRIGWSIEHQGRHQGRPCPIALAMKPADTLPTRIAIIKAITLIYCGFKP
jgi:hypothetical protein